MQQVKRSVHKVMYILLYTRTAVAVVIDAHNGVPGTRMVGIMHDDMQYISSKCQLCSKPAN